MQLQTSEPLQQIMLARYYEAGLGRFISVDDHSGKPRNPQSWNRYAYVQNNPLLRIDPDGRDGIAVVYPDYKVGTPVGKLALGHAAAIAVEKGTGKTTYYEYGRYGEDNTGRVRTKPTPSLQFGKDGLPTKDSMQSLLKSVSDNSGQGGKVEAAYFKGADATKMVSSAEATMAQNDKPSKPSYDLNSNNCATFAQNTLEAGGVSTPEDVLPGNYIDDAKANADASYTYEPPKETDQK